MYSSVLFVHSWLRWLVVISLLVVLSRALYGYFKSTFYTKFDNLSAIILIACTHIQILLGLWLYFFLSPLTAHSSVSNFMKNPILRYWKLEHFFMMILFLIIVQTGRIVSKKKVTDKQKHKIMVIYSLIGVIILAFGMPWPNKPYGRPLFRETLSFVHTADYPSEMKLQQGARSAVYVTP